MVVPATIVSSIIGALNGFVFAKLPFRGANVTFAAMLLGMFIPYQVILVPLVRFLQFIDLYGTLQGLILVRIIYGVPITTLIFRNYYRQIPDAILEASQVDGASNLQIFTRVMLPLSMPGFVVCAIFQFTNIWNDFLFGITVVPDPTKQPITVALNNLSGNFSVQWNTVMAGAVIAAVPTAIVYILLGRFFVRGLTADTPWRANNLAPHRELVRRVTRTVRRAGYPLIFTERMGVETNSHQCGTVVMGTDPARSVLGPTCRAHEVDNLWVVDSACFPSSAALNPALTIAANALRVAATGGIIA